ncbi:hypothetical protein T310_9889, partial [Rasamsonia emersonii CBS 393.64]
KVVRGRALRQVVRCLERGDPGQLDRRVLVNDTESGRLLDPSLTTIVKYRRLRLDPARNKRMDGWKDVANICLASSLLILDWCLRSRLFLNSSVEWKFRLVWSRL